MDKTTKFLMLAGGGALILGPSISGWLANRAANTAGATAVNLITGTATGAVIAAGNALGIPETNLTQCQKDLMAGKTWDASFSCPALDFLKYEMNGTIPGVNNLNGLGAAPVFDWKTLALLGGAVYLMMKKKGR
jgi:hypothetical protein